MEAPAENMYAPICARCGHKLTFSGFWDGTDKTGQIHHGFLYRFTHCGNEVIDES